MERLAASATDVNMNIAVAHRLADFGADKKRLARANAFAKRAFEIDPKYVGSLEAVAKMRFHSADWAGFLESYKPLQFKSTNPSFQLSGNLSMAIAYAKLGEDERASKSLKKAIAALEPEFANGDLSQKWTAGHLSQLREAEIVVHGRAITISRIV